MRDIQCCNYSPGLREASSMASSSMSGLNPDMLEIVPIRGICMPSFPPIFSSKLRLKRQLDTSWRQRRPGQSRFLKSRFPRVLHLTIRYLGFSKRCKSSLTCPHDLPLLESDNLEIRDRDLNYIFPQFLSSASRCQIKWSDNIKADAENSSDWRTLYL